ncbi:MAG: hypothetical protein ABH826_00265, partial [Patescibacteria group bacterium]
MSKMKQILSGLGILSVLALVGAGCAGVEPTLSLEKTSFEPGEMITVSFTALEDYDTYAWVGVIPADLEHGDEALNDQYDLEYKYLRNETEGTLTFTAPAQPGSYDLRMHSADSDGEEVTYVGFTVTESTNLVEPTLSLAKTTFAAGETITVTFTAPATYDSSAWVGLVPSNIAHGNEATNDENDLEFEYLNSQTSGTLTFTAPDEAGSYDLRLNS